MATAHSKAFEQIVQAISMYISEMADDGVDLNAIKTNARTKFSELKPDDLSAENSNLWDQYTLNFFNVLDTFRNKEASSKESVPMDEIIQQTPLPSEEELVEIKRFVDLHPAGPTPTFADLTFQQEAADGGELGVSLAPAPSSSSSSSSSNAPNFQSIAPQAIKKRTRITPTTVESTPTPAPAPEPSQAPQKKTVTVIDLVDDDDDDDLVEIVSQKTPKSPMGGQAKSPPKAKEKKNDDAMDVDEDIFEVVAREEKLKQQKAQAEQQKGAKRLHGDSAAKIRPPSDISDSDDDDSESSDDASRIKPPTGAKPKVLLVPPAKLTLQPPSALRKPLTLPGTKAPTPVSESENKPAEPKKPKTNTGTPTVPVRENIKTNQDTQFSVNVYDLGIKGRFDTQKTRFYIIADTTEEGNPERIKWWQQVRPTLFTNVISFGKDTLRNNTEFQFSEDICQVLILMKAKTENNATTQLLAALGQIKSRRNWVILHCWEDEDFFMNKGALTHIPFFANGNFTTTELGKGVYQTASNDVELDNPNAIAEQFRSMRI